MKKIINGKVYDTDTARKVGVNGSECGCRDFNWWTETLYCKRTGEYFLHGEGGANSRYSKRIDTNSWTGGEKLMPMTVADARSWAEDNLSADEYEREFGQVTEDDSRTTLSISIRADVAESARRKAAELGMSLSAFIESCIK